MESIASSALAIRCPQEQYKPPPRLLGRPPRLQFAHQALTILPPSVVIVPPLVLTTFGLPSSVLAGNNT